MTWIIRRPEKTSYDGKIKSLTLYYHKHQEKREPSGSEEHYIADSADWAHAHHNTMLR